MKSTVNHSQLDKPKTGSLPILYLVKADETNIVYDCEHNSFFNLNSTALEIWTHIANGKPEAWVRKHIITTYGVEEKTAAEDLRELLGNLAQKGITPGSVRLIDTASCRIERAAGSKRLSPYIPNAAGIKPRLLTTMSAWMGLCLFDVFLHLRPFKELCKHVSTWPVASRRTPADPEKTIHEVCAGIARACIWYPKRALCLQRSTVTACYLRHRGIAAKLIIAVRPVPFVAHAWVEVDGYVVNDRPRVQQFYQTVTSY
jgi:hypothetical protein